MKIEQYSLDSIENILKNDPDNAEAWRIKGDILLSKFFFNQSLECYSKSIECDPNYFDAWCGKGKVNIFQNNTIDAIQCLDKAISIQNSAYAFQLKSHAIPSSKFNQKKIQKNIEIALKLDPENINLLTSQALHFRRFKHEDKSIFIFEKILTTDPEHIIAQISLERFKNSTLNTINYICNRFSIEKNNFKEIEYFADIFFSNFDLITARHCYNYLILSKNNNQSASKKLARFYLMKNDIKNAQELFLNITKNNDADSDSWVRLGETYRRQNKMLDAIKCFDFALKIMPENAEAWRRKGFAQSMRHENINDAIKCLDRSLELEPYHPMTLTQKSMYLRRSNKTLSDALYCLDKALKIDPTFILAWKQKAETFTSLNNFEDTLKCYEKIMELDSDDVITWYNIGVIKSKFCEIQFQTGKKFFEHEDYNKALECFEKVLKFDLNDLKTLELKTETISRSS